MKVLLLPFNIASKGAITIDALNRINGVEAKGVFVNKNSKVASSDFARHFNVYSFRKDPIGWFSTYIKKSIYINKMIKWADVLHWIWDSGFSSQWDLKLARSLGKPGIIEWSGSDIRYPERNFEINPYASLLYNPEYEYRQIETKENSFRRQEKFSKMGFAPLVTPEMDLYIRKDLFSKSYITLHRLNIKDFRGSNLGNTKPLIVHSPTRRMTKGTKYILEAVEQLKNDFDFEFKLLEGIPREDTLKIIASCDIFIDQLLLGSYGMASCEAMSMSKPVLCYIMKSVYDNGLPLECPIINTNPDSIKNDLALLLGDSSYRETVGKKSRQYAENFLDVDIQAKELVKIYGEVISRKRQ